MISDKTVINSAIRCASKYFNMGGFATVETKVYLTHGRQNSVNIHARDLRFLFSL